MSIINNVLSKVVGSRHDRVIKKFTKLVAQVNSFEKDMQSLGDDELRAKTQQFRERLDKEGSLESILPEAFAVVREASQRVLGERHYDVQLIGGMVLNEGCISEMGTGEGKTLVATLPAYINALSGKGVHIVTVNDYLAKRDAEWMGKVFSFLGLEVGVVISGMSGEEKKAAYNCDVTYATNNELGFDYLRDNMAFSQDQKTQKTLNYAIIDEVDSILIDEARTPLVISGPTGDHAEVYIAIDKMIPLFTLQTETGEGKEVVVNIPGDYTLDQKQKQVFLTDDGHVKAEELLINAGALPEESSLYDASNIILLQHLISALRAHVLFQKNVDYIVKDDEVVIVDEFTGRTMPGRRWSAGLHQAIEAKERVSVKQENQTVASITYQNYFRLYNKLSGMTGTAETEAPELLDIYGLEVVVVPPNAKSCRSDLSDLIYGTMDEKLDAIIGDVKACQKMQQPVLVGTSSIESSESISLLLKKDNVRHEVLNAKQHQREAEIIANAGAPSAVTIATNMAGRGTDIVLGGRLPEETSDAEKLAWKEKHAAVISAGGLHIIGTERNESRRVDNQLRGRSGRQGDVGSTRFYLSLEDSLMKIFASEKTASMMKKLGMKEGEALEHSWLNRTIANAQKKVEGMHYDARKHLLEFDDVANDQRSVIYQLRNDILSSDNISDVISGISEEVIQEMVKQYIDPDVPEDQWDLEGLSKAINSEFTIEMEIEAIVNQDDTLEDEQIWKTVLNQYNRHYDSKEQSIGPKPMREIEKAVMLQQLDFHWREHLGAMDYLRQGIHLRGYAQKNPKQEYKKESFEMFSYMMDQLKSSVVSILARVRFRGEEDADTLSQQTPDMTEVELKHRDPNTFEAPLSKSSDALNEANQRPYVRTDKKIGRNQPCPCGSGKKYKKCHGAIQQ